MSRTKLNVNVNNFNFLQVNNPASKGSDWGNTTLPQGTIIPQESQSFFVGSIGNPGTFETDHWGWLYFWVGNVANSGLSFPMQLYIKVTNGGNKTASAGWYDPDSSESNPQPIGTFGK